MTAQRSEACTLPTSGTENPPIHDEPNGITQNTKSQQEDVEGKMIK